MWLILPILLSLHVVICLLLVLVILMQLPRSEGLGAAFGSAVTENIFGAQTTHVLAKFTVWLGVAFFVVTLMLAVAYSRRETGSRVQQELLNTAAPSATATPAAAPSPEAATSPTSSLEVGASPAPSPEATASPVSSPAASPAAKAP